MNIKGLAKQLNKLAPNIGLSYRDCKQMINSRMCLTLDRPILDIVAFGNWVKSTYPEYLSIESFLKEKDPSHFYEWRAMLIGLPI